MRTLGLALTVVFGLSIGGLSLGCGDSNKGTTKQAPMACKSKKDCKPGLVCLAGECADPRVNTGPANMVTPDKVKREVEKIGRDAEDRRDKVLDEME